MKIALWKWMVGGFVIIGIFFPAYSKIQKLKQKDQALTQDLERLTAENARLTEENDMLRNDPVYVEEIAREKLKVARENEIIFRVINEDTE